MRKMTKKKKIVILLSGMAITCLLSVGFMYQTGVLPLQTKGSTVSFEDSVIAIEGGIRVTLAHDEKIVIENFIGRRINKRLVAGTHDIELPPDMYYVYVGIQPYGGVFPVIVR